LLLQSNALQQQLAQRSNSVLLLVWVEGVAATSTASVTGP
jgi:hypothetical protein